MPRDTVEGRRVEEMRSSQSTWRLWGPYLSERQWGTVREDYSREGDAWRYFPFEHAHSRAYRWGEDGLFGISDDRQQLCLSLALWNEKDPILKERLFGLTNEQGNHGEDAKELYYYLDATPTHSYLLGLYKYPQRAFPYATLVAENARRGKNDPEFELLDTGIFDDDHYFDIRVEYAKANPTDILMRVTATNRGPDTAPLHILPHVWYRNVWSWVPDAPLPIIVPDGPNELQLLPAVGMPYRLRFDTGPTLLFCENETNAKRLFGSPGAAYPKDAFHEYVVNGKQDAVNPVHTGSKAAAHYRFDITAGDSVVVRLRLTAGTEWHIASGDAGVGDDFDTIFAQRIMEANEYYQEIQAEVAGEDARRVQRQAFAGLIWTKQYYEYDVTRWLTGDTTQPTPPPDRQRIRNQGWSHFRAADVLSMPDKWEYPWFAAWDTAFHMIPFAIIDPEFAKNQLVLFCREWYTHPNGQLPAYEWNFSDVNPPVHAWAAWRVYQIDREHRAGIGDVPFLERIFHKLMLNFTWWVNRKDATGRNIFQGGFLGLDNIGVFDRSQPLPTGGYINQADGTAWMGMYSLNMLRIAIELALHNPVYQDVASKFFEHFLNIAQAMTALGGEVAGQAGVGLWDNEDGFYYDELTLPDGRMIPLRVRSIVGLIPLFAVETLEPEVLRKLPEFNRRLEWLLRHRPELAALVSRWEVPGSGERRLLSLLRGHRMKKLLRRMLDSAEFLSDYGIRALSKFHQSNPYTFRVGDNTLTVRYQPAESDSRMFGGNSNWRGPIWFPTNYLIVESLLKFHHYYGDDFRVEHPTGSGQFRTLAEIANDLAARLGKIFLRDKQGRRAVFGRGAKLQTDPHFRDHILFHEYFDGDTGRGVGASHQTGWTALIARLLMPLLPRAPELSPEFVQRQARRFAPG